MTLGAAVTLFLVLVSQAQITVSDGTSMLAVAQSIVHDGTLSVPADMGVPGDDGNSYSKYGLLLPLLSVFPVLLVQPIGEITGRVDLLEAAAAGLLMPIITGALAAALFLLGRRLGAPPVAAALVATGVLLGTYVLPYGRDFFTEPLVALFLVVMIERALAGRELEAGAALAFAVLARPQSALLAPLLFGFIAARGGGLRGIAHTLPPLAISGAVTIAYNLYRFSDPLEFGYKPPVDPGFTTPLLEGTGGLLFSPEKSLFLFAPVVVLAPFALVALWRRQRATAALLVGLFAAIFVLSATWHSWMGGWSWGPRLLIPGVVVVLVALGPWIGEDTRRLRLTGAMFAVGFAISISAVIAHSGVQHFDTARGSDGPQIVRQVREIPQLTRNSIDAADDPDARDKDYRRYLSLWQANAVRQFGKPGFLVAALGTIALLAALLWVLRRLHREMTRVQQRNDGSPTPAQNLH